MPVNRNALIRYKTIDKCLQNYYRKWTLEDLIEACSEALYEYEGIDKGVSKRTIQADIQIMRSDKLGYNAPIIVLDKKYYQYESKEYSITNIPLTDQDLSQLNEAVSFLKQFSGFSHFRQLDGMVQKLEDHIYSHQKQTHPVIDFEKNENLKGLNFLDSLYKYIINKKAVELTYQSFTARNQSTFIFNPYLLKEYRNRWFVLGTKMGESSIINLALDRLISVNLSSETYESSLTFQPETYFSSSIGVSVSSNAEIHKVILEFDRKHAPYVETKPLHPSQKVIDRTPHTVIFSIDVQHSFELEKEILSYGSSVTVLKPVFLRRRILENLKESVSTYETQLNPKSLRNSQNLLSTRGYAVLNSVYSLRELKKINHSLKKYFKQNPKNTSFYIRSLFKVHSEITPLILTDSILRIVQTINPNAFLTKAMFLKKENTSNWHVTWHQDLTINVTEKIEIEGFTGWSKKEDFYSVLPSDEISKDRFTIRIHLDETTHKNGALETIPGSHKSVHSTETLENITKNSVGTVCDVKERGVMLMHPLIIHRSKLASNNKKRRVIHLEFSTSELPHGLEYSEKMKLAEL